MKSSVVIPAHNSAQWIGESLESVFAQTRLPDEVIVVNDASTDETEDRVRTLYPDVQVINTDYRNAAAARNEGVRAATGDYVAFLDADDTWYPHHLDTALSMLGRSADIAYLAHNDQDRYDSSGSVTRVDRDTDPPVSRATSGLAGVVFFKWWARKAWFFTGTCVVNKERFAAISGFDPSQVRRHDFEMFLRLVEGNTWSYSPEPACLYRFLMNANAISSNELETTYYTLRALLRNKDRYPGPQMDEAVARWSRVLCRKSIRAGSDRWITTEADPFAALSRPEAAFYRCALSRLQLSARVYSAMRSFKQRIVK